MIRFEYVETWDIFTLFNDFPSLDIDIQLGGKDNARRYIFSRPWHYLPCVWRPSCRAGRKEEILLRLDLKDS